jgi:hypothetical protein
LTAGGVLGPASYALRHKVRINNAEPIAGISTINDSQTKVLETLNIKKPTQDTRIDILMRWLTGAL